MAKAKEKKHFVSEKSITVIDYYSLYDKDNSSEELIKKWEYYLEDAKKAWVISRVY